MKKPLLLLVLLTAPLFAVRGQQTKSANSNGWWNDNPSFAVPIREVGVSAQRPMKEIGLQQTQLDTTVLHEHIALSMADVLTFNTSIFVKQYGRATLSTVAFRGTSPSHTQVTWNGMRINSPMLGMTDFSMIPSYFVDDASLLHGTSSVHVSGGGLGGAVKLATKPFETRGVGLRYVQGIGSFKTFDEFLRLTYGDERWQLSTRAVYSSSDNDFKYRNYNKTMHVYDEDHQIVDTYYPIERNRSGDFRDFHILQEAYYNTGRGDRFALQGWYIRSRRGLPMLNVDYRSEALYRSEQREQTFRGILSWERMRERYKLGAHAGYVHTRQAYDFSQDKGNGVRAEMVRSRSFINTLYGQVEGEYYVGRRWLFTAEVSVYQHFVKSRDKNVLELNPQSLGQGNARKVAVGYDQQRFEGSAYVSAKWRPHDRLGVSLAVREELSGGNWTPIIPAFFTDYLLSERGKIVVRASVSRNFRFPTLNDLYFLPGGNPDLKKEHGFTYDAGLSCAVGRQGVYSLSGEAAWFDSRIDDWIVWLPTFKGFWTPRNIKEVHAYGVELKGKLEVQLSQKWQLGLDGTFSWTPSINRGDPADWADEAIGRQLVYVPEYAAAATGRLCYESWRLIYKWCYYSERFTTSDNDVRTKIGRVRPYYMSDVTLEKLFSFRWSDFSVRLAVKNLFNEPYESVLSRPMPRLNYELFLDIRPKWGKRR